MKGGEVMSQGETYEDFIAKFEYKRTTDDCYTPPEVYNTICDFVEQEFCVTRDKFVRPFYPGGIIKHLSIKMIQLL